MCIFEFAFIHIHVIPGLRRDRGYLEIELLQLINVDIDLHFQ